MGRRQACIRRPHAAAALSVAPSAVGSDRNSERVDLIMIRPGRCRSRSIACVLHDRTEPYNAARWRNVRFRCRLINISRIIYMFIRINCSLKTRNRKKGKERRTTCQRTQRVKLLSLVRMNLIVLLYRTHNSPISILFFATTLWWNKTVCDSCDRLVRNVVVLLIFSRIMAAQWAVTYWQIHPFNCNAFIGWLKATNLSSDGNFVLQTNNLRVTLQP